METDFVNTSVAIASFLAPFMPYLVEGGKKFASKAGEAAWDKAQNIWQRINSRYNNDPKVIGAALIVSADPSDKDACYLFAKSIALKLQESQGFAQEMLELLGGREAVQEILVENSSWAEKISQEITGDLGHQVLHVKNDSVVVNVRQKMESKDPPKNKR